jgi:4-hydroxyphenylacetate 3-monooxygenase
MTTLEGATGVVTAPFTGAEYIESLRDGREIYIYGERVDDATTHPAFRNTIRSVAHLYDALHDPEYHDVLTTPTDTGNGGFTHKFFRAARSQQDMAGARDAIATWCKLSYGFMGRTPDFKATFTATLGDLPEFYGEYADNARAWYKLTQERVPFINHAIVNPPVDRDRGADDNDVYIRVVKETDAGVIVSGAKMVATGSMFTNYTFVANFQPVFKEEYAIVFFVDMKTPGVKSFARPSYEMTAGAMGNPYDYPLSSRFDENDAILVFDNVLIPWENVLIYRDIDKSNHFLPATGFAERAMLHGTTRMGVKLDLISGLMMMALEAAGTNTFRGVQANIGEVLAWRQLAWALSDALVSNTTQTPTGMHLPNAHHAIMTRLMNAIGWPRVKDIIYQVVAGGLIVQPSSALDFANPSIRPYLDRYFRGSNGYDAESRNKVIKLLWDALGSEFGGRHDLYERNYAGNHEIVRINVLNYADMSGLSDQLKGFADKCMSDYDLNGWVNPIWASNDDLSVLSKP